MLYEYQCTDIKCLHVTVELRSVADRFKYIECEKCNAEAKKVMSIPSRSWGIKAEVENYPMVNHFLSKPGEPPVVFENATERKQYYKRHGLVDAVTPDAERPTMYTNDADCENYEKFDKFKDIEDRSQYVRVPDHWEDKPVGEENV
jgi:hypothetical protein